MSHQNDYDFVCERLLFVLLVREMSFGMVIYFLYRSVYESFFLYRFFFAVMFNYALRPSFVFTCRFSALSFARSCP
jgi:hypothetical protein